MSSPTPHALGSEPRSEATPPATFGVYVHFPYCLTKCPYCDFLSIPEQPEAIPHVAYAEAVIAELERRAPSVAGLRMHSVFFGGGTPSLWAPSELTRVLAALRARFGEVDEGAEVTVECNPGSFDRGIAERLREGGVNRISLGVQSLSAERLAFLGRHHDATEALDAIRVARASGFANVSADLIFGVAGQSAAEAEEEATRVTDEGVTHVSAYALTIEPGTRFGELHRAGRLPLLPDENVAEGFESVHAALEARGYEHYEISNYARPGREARHNLGYWRGEPYLGLGVGAWGTIRESGGKTRYRNTPSLERYLRLPEDRTELSPIQESPWVAVVEAITPEVDLSERLMLGLRLAEGVDCLQLERDTGAAVFTPGRRRAIEKWVARGALSSNDGKLRLSKAHWLLSDAVLREIL